MLRRLDRYLLAEIFGPLALGFLIYTFMLLFRVLFRMAELIIRSNVSLETVGRLLLLSLPNIVVLTIPMSFLFAILIAVGRLSSDSELIAIRASGISLFSMYRPILVLSAILTGINIYLMLELLPQGNHAFQRLDMDIKTQGLSNAVQPRVPHTGWEDKMLYVFEAPPGERRWKGTFLTDAIPSGEMQIEIAKWGEARINPETSEVVLTLTDTSTHSVDLTHPRDYNIASHKEVNLSLTSGRMTPAAKGSIKRGLRELSFHELRRIARDPEETKLTRRMAEIEIHKKFSFPAACIVFGLLGLPLGFTNARGGRSSGFAISIAVVLVYYIVFNWGEDFAKKGAGPTWLAVWMPNIALFAVGLFLLFRRNSDKSPLFSRLDRWIQENLWRHLLSFRKRREDRNKRRQEALEARRSGHDAHDGDQVVLRLPEFRLPFPTLIDRYILTAFLRVLAIVSCSALAVYIVADLTENAEHILKNDVPYSVVLDYYKYKSFDIIYQISPIIVLITTLISFGLLSRTNEITALKALGMSLYRMSLPVVLAAVVLSGLCVLLQMEVLTASNERVSDLKAQIRGEASPTRSQRADQRWLYGKQGGYLYNYGHYDAERQELQRLQVFQFDTQYNLVRRLVIDKATYIEDGQWRMTRGWAREFGDGEDVFNPIDEPVKMALPEPPEFFEGVQRLPEQMHFTELKEYIQDLRTFGGEDIAPLEVELHNKIAYPVMVLVMALVALPFAFRLGRQGALYGIGLSLILGIALLIFQAFFQAMGQAAVLPAAVAMWSPGVIFSIFALYLFLGVRT